MKNIYFHFGLWFAVLLTACSPTEEIAKDIKVTSIYLSDVDSNNEIVLVEGSEKQLNVVVSPEDATNKTLSYTSSNKAVFTVGSNSKLIAIQEGTASLIISAEDESQITITHRIIVRSAENTIPITSLTVDNAAEGKIFLTTSGTLQLQTTVLPDNASVKTVVYESENKEIFTVTPSGVLTGISTGEGELTVTAGDNSGVKASYIVVVTEGGKLVQSVSIGNIANGIRTLQTKSTFSVQIKILPENADNKNVTYTSSNEKFFTVNSSGVISALAAGSANVTVTALDPPYASATASIIVTTKAPDLTGPDGPYVLYQTDGSAKVVYADEGGYIIGKTVQGLTSDFTLNVISHDKKSRFDVKLQPTLQRSPSKRSSPDKLFVLSDPHANFNAFINILKAKNVIDSQLNWSYGANELFIAGDVFDRGDDAVTIFWLVYKLQQEARDAGGRVSFILGNHESMVLMNSLDYTNQKYKDFAKIYFNATTQYGTKFFNKDTELGRWLGTCNTIEIIGTDLFVHAGLGKAFYDKSLEIDRDVNTIMSEGIFLGSSGRNNLSTHSQFLFSSSSSAVGGAGPIWYRGMVGYSDHELLSEATLDLLLQRYGVKRIIVGHTIHTDISTYYGGKVIDVNVDNQKNWDADRGRGILIEKGKTYIVYDTKADKELQ
ncbi:hypothetical protein EZS27_026736 [termite gut metagenome]|uniref:BIG2 domain-containing protein n=1 Tax=termite gut metagenome TaxID=433724 RepID=A0A5J4QSB4_9ZZZZ